MGLESGSVIEDLQSEWPLGGDPTNQGDNHLRLIKNVLKLQFVGAGGNGFATPITATEEELNWLGGLSGNVQEQFDALGVRIDNLEGVLNAPAGTALLFYQAEAPLGWEQDESKQDFMVRVVSAVGGGSGGADSPILNNKVPVHTHTFSGGSTDEAGGHDHRDTLRGGIDAENNGVYPAGSINSHPSDPDLEFEMDGMHTHTVSGTVGNNVGAEDWRPQYINTIIAVKS